MTSTKIKKADFLPLIIVAAVATIINTLTMFINEEKRSLIFSTLDSPSQVVAFTALYFVVTLTIHTVPILVIAWLILKIMEQSEELNKLRTVALARKVDYHLKKTEEYDERVRVLVANCAFEHVEYAQKKSGKHSHKANKLIKKLEKRTKQII